MYCSNCGNKLEAESKFCNHCGGKVVINPNRNSSEGEKNVFKVNEDTIPPNENNSNQIRESETEATSEDYAEGFYDISIPSIMGSKIIRFSDDSVEYGNTIINYVDLVGVSCKMVFHSMNLIPTQQEYSFNFHSANSKISLNFGTTLHIGNKDRKEIFMELYIISKRFLSQFIVEKLKNRIIAGETVQIGDVYFSNQGYFVKTLFGLGSDKWVHWTDRIAEPDMHQGSIYLYKQSGEKFNNIASVSLEKINAIFIPELVLEMYALNNE